MNAGNVSFPPQGGNGSVQVNANRDCSWSAKASAGWIHLGAGSGQGDGVIPFSVDQNPQTTSRGGAIEVSNAGQVSVTQAAQPPPPPPPPPASGPSPSPGPTPDPGPTPPGSGEHIELKGQVQFLIGSCPDLGFLLSDRAVRTNSDTDFKGMKCSDVRNGRTVNVKGVVRNDGIVIATEVRKD
ncbi:MAG: BACON domain-containing protein [Acidobacteriota bacterium]